MGTGRGERACGQGVDTGRDWQRAGKRQTTELEVRAQEAGRERLERWEHNAGAGALRNTPAVCIVALRIRGLCCAPSTTRALGDRQSLALGLHDLDGLGSCSITRSNHTHTMATCVSQLYVTGRTKEERAGLAADSRAHVRVRNRTVRPEPYEQKPGYLRHTNSRAHACSRHKSRAIAHASQRRHRQPQHVEPRLQAPSPTMARIP